MKNKHWPSYTNTKFVITDIHVSMDLADDGKLITLVASDGTRFEGLTRKQVRASEKYKVFLDAFPGATEIPNDTFSEETLYSIVQLLRYNHEECLARNLGHLAVALENTMLLDHNIERWITTQMKSMLYRMVIPMPQFEFPRSVRKELVRHFTSSVQSIFALQQLKATVLELQRIVHMPLQKLQVKWEEAHDINVSSSFYSICASRLLAELQDAGDILAPIVLAGRRTQNADAVLQGYSVHIMHAVVGGDLGVTQDIEQKIRALFPLNCDVSIEGRRAEQETPLHVEVRQRYPFIFFYMYLYFSEVNNARTASHIASVYARFNDTSKRARTVDSCIVCTGRPKYVAAEGKRTYVFCSRRCHTKFF